MTQTKRCRQCGRCLPETAEFFASRERGLRAQCRDCMRERDRVRRTDPEVRERIRQTQAKFNAQPHVAAQRKAYQDKYREDGRPAISRAARKARMTEADREEARRYARNYYHSVMSEEQRDRKRRRQNERQAERRESEPRFRLRHTMSAFIHDSLRKRGSKKPAGWQSLVGYSVEDLRRHLERQFTRGMSWENYGEWHVDHIRPIACFDWQSAEDPGFKSCWALSNLRPLWAQENRKKSGKRLHLL